MTEAANSKKTLKDALNEEKLATLKATIEGAMVETYQPLLDLILNSTGNKDMNVTLVADTTLTFDEDSEGNVSASNGTSFDLKFSPEDTHDIYEQAMRQLVQVAFAQALES